MRIILFTVSALMSCQFYSEHDEAVLLWPSEGLSVLGGQGPDSWDLSYLEAGGKVVQRRVSGGARISVKIPRESPVLVAARPVTPGIPQPWKAHPAGYVRSAEDTRTATIQLSWGEGFTASYLLKLARAGLNPERLNVGRMASTAEQRSDGRMWELDLRHLGSNLSNGNLRVYSFRLLPRVKVVWPLPSGIWYGSHALDPPITATFNRHLELVTGMHHFHSPETGTTASLSVSDDGRAVALWSQ